MGLRSKAHSSINLKPDGSHQKMSLSMLNTSTSPGPARYEVKHIYRKQNIGGKIGRESRDSISVRPQSANIPAPNSFSAEIKNVMLKKAPCYGFGTSQRPNSGRVSSPGPGAYNPTLSRIQSAKTIGIKWQNKSVIEQPGPGHY
jgi:hypothetical protein